MQQPFVSALYVYPVKSLGGYSVKEIDCVEKGLLHDRRYMLVDDSNIFITQRKTPQMALLNVRPSATKNGFTVSRQNEALHFNADDFNDEIRCRIWHDAVSCLRANSHINEWFSDKLGFSCSLVFFPEHETREIHFPESLDHREQQTSLSDAYPLLVLSNASLNYLNSKLGFEIMMDRFRPNIVIDNVEAHEEDSWKQIAIGNNVVLELIKPCARCVVVTINQQTAKKSAEPLFTLSKYRRAGNKVNFGMDAVVKNNGIIRLNDTIRLLN